MNPILIALLIFCLRIVDVSIGTVRVIYTIRGARMISAVLGFVESFIWIFAISWAVTQMTNLWNMIGWSCGFAAGIMVGVTIEKWIASGWILLRVISMGEANDLREKLLEQGFGVTAVPGEGRSGPVRILFIVLPRRRGKDALDRIRDVDPDAFITIDSINQAIGGYVPSAFPSTAIRK